MNPAAGKRSTPSMRREIRFMRPRNAYGMLCFVFLAALVRAEPAETLRGELAVGARPLHPGSRDDLRVPASSDGGYAKSVLDGALGVCWGIAADDLDRDGDPDIVISQAYKLEITWFENMSTPDSNVPEFQKAQLYKHVKDSPDQIAGNIYHVEIADLDGDGLKDIVFGQYGAGLYALYGQGSAFSDTVKVSSHCFWMFEIADMNKDGLPDIVGNNDSWEPTLYYIEQSAARTFTEHLIDPDCGDAYGIDAADLDGDGDMDIVQGSANWFDELVWYENDGEESFTRHVVDAYVDDPLDLVCTDLDEDGDTDIVVSAASDHELLWYENDGSEQFVPHTVVDSVEAIWFVRVADLDQNDSLDIAAADRDGSGILWFSRKAGNMFEARRFDPSVQYPQDFVIRDFNGDGKPDIALISGQSSEGDFSKGQLTLYLKDTAARIDPEPDIPLPGTAALHPNYPNPFNSVTIVSFDLPAAGRVRLDVIDSRGRRIRTLADGWRPAGRHRIPFNAGELASGVYLVRIRTPHAVQTRKLIVTR